MSKTNPVAHVDPLEILAHWEGPAIHDRGVLFGEKQAQQLDVGGDAAEMAA